MPHIATLLGFALISLGMVLTPGPNMIYLISRSITQGPAAGIVSLPMTRCGLPAPRICCGWRGRRSSPTGARRFRSGNCKSTARANCSRWGSSPIF
jgi:hypothetical protein